MPYKKKRRKSVSRRLKIVMLACVAVAVALGVGALFMAQQERLAQNAAEAANYTPAPVAAAAERPVLAVVGDSFSAEDEATKRYWPRQLAANGGYALLNKAVGGSGYGSPEDSYREQAQQVIDSELEPDILIIAGSRNDERWPDVIAPEAAAVYDLVAANLPDTEVIVIGPMWDNDAPSRSIVAINDTIEAAATEAGFPFVDALEGNWLSDPAWVHEDGIHPSDTGQSQLLQQISAVVEEAGFPTTN